MPFTYKFQHSGSNRRVRKQLDRLIREIDEDAFTGLDAAQASAIDALTAQREQAERRRSGRAVLRDAAKGGR